ncbi:MAG: CarD family transcriptional regulator [Bacillales bacterium]|nr:CarD family transcriptional regulator [Bacillales bacterium]
MFQINDKVVHVNGGVFNIENTIEMTYGGVTNKYFTLKPLYVDFQNKTLTIYVPEDKCDILMRHVMTKKEAEGLLELIKTIEPIWFNESKTRKEKFAEYVKSGKLENICLVMKSLYVQQMKLNDDNKSLNLLDYDYLNKLKKEVEEEIAVALGVEKEKVPGMIMNFIK